MRTFYRKLPGFYEKLHKATLLKSQTPQIRLNRELEF